MSSLTDLYQEVVLDHHRHPRNYGPLAHANRHADGHNPLCGDRLTIFAEVESGAVRDVHFEGSGCAISRASASLMTEAVKGRTIAETHALARRFRAMVTAPIDAPEDTSLGKLTVLAGVRLFPVRIKCATLAWHALEQALKIGGDGGTTAGSGQP